MLNATVSGTLLPYLPASHVDASWCMVSGDATAYRGGFADESECADIRDHLVSALTAFRTWRDLESAMRDGYVPTLDPRQVHASLRVAVETLRGHVFAEGWSVFPRLVR